MTHENPDKKKLAVKRHPHSTTESSWEEIRQHPIIWSTFLLPQLYGRTRGGGGAGIKGQVYHSRNVGKVWNIAQSRDLRLYEQNIMCNSFTTIQTTIGDGRKSIYKHV